MEDIWKRIMEGQENLRYEQADFFSPYCESVIGSIRKQEETDKIQINAFYRYGDIFQQLFRLEDRDDSVCTMLYDYMMHLLTRLELRNGVTRNEYGLRQKWYQIEQGAYGERVQKKFHAFDRDRKYKAAFYVWKQDKLGDSVALFAKALITVLGDGVLYKNDINPKELLLYIGRKQRDLDTAVTDFATEMFLPFHYSLRIFYEASFGIIDDRNCMELEQIEIF